ncbi:GPI ethanolamine phosphate transferase 1-like [Rhodnius prolixus]|uniref:GPI ethanolamine phosphate transferase 1-like n=1 Tax=Rhodnius prolixus TaxID=13249 RepID=UPI003D18F80F
MIWSLLSSLLCAVIILIGYEIVLTPNALHGKFNQSICSNLPERGSPAKRLVLILVDAMKEKSADARWVTSFVKKAGRGVSIAARPMTRPGLVAMFSGTYENIFTFLPVIFGYDTSKDNIFRHVDHTFYFGPEDSFKYFKGGDQWISQSYPTDRLDLQNRPYSSDDYIMDGIHEMLEKPADKHKKMKYKNIFFIHLSGLDLEGHTARIGSNLLAKGAYRMGSMISQTMELFENYYLDNRTAYLIISDHGMTDWGTHADSQPEEIRTPIIVSGSGCASGILPTIRQIDVCPLTAALLGIPVPAESIGILYKQYLNISLSSLAFSSMCSAIQLADLCQTSWERIENGLVIRHFIAKTMTKCNYMKYLQVLTELIAEKNYSAVINESENLTNFSLDCLTNIQNVYKTSFLFLLLMSYLAWIFGTLGTMSMKPSSGHPYAFCAGKLVIILTCVGYALMLGLSIASVMIEKLPNYYIVFMVVPSLVWLVTTLKSRFCMTKLMHMKQFTVLFYILAVLMMAEYTYWVKYLPYLFPIYLIPYACILAAMNHKFVPRHVTCLWIITSCALMAAPLIPLLGLPESAVLLNVSSALWIIGSGVFGYVLRLKNKECVVTLIAASVICLATWIIDLNYLGSNVVLRVLAWAVLPMPLMIFFASSVLAERLLQIVLLFVGPYTLLSLRHEALVLLLMSLNLYCWLRLEASSPQYEGQHFVRGLTLYYYCVLSVYASGNVPYISSFDIMCTRLFTTVLNDVLIGILVSYKLSIFLTIVVCYFCATSKYVGEGLQQMLLVAILISAVSSLRHSIGIIIYEEPIAALPEFLLGNAHFLSLLIPFNLSPILVTVKKQHS